MEGMKLVIGSIAGLLIVWLVLEGIGSYLQFSMTFGGWWLIGPASIILILWSIVYTAFWVSSDDFDG